MTPFQAGKTYPLYGGGQGEIFVTKDGQHWGRKTDLDGYWSIPTVWNEYGIEVCGYGGNLITPPTTITRYLNLYSLNNVQAVQIHKDKYSAELAALITATHKAIPIHITTHSDGRIEIKGGSE